MTVADHVLKPYVAVDRTYIAIVLWLARKYAYFVAYDRGVRVVRKPLTWFNETYKPLVAAGVPYSVQVAARKYLDWGSRAGITDVATQALNNILKGKLDMSDVENTSSTQGEATTKGPAAPSAGALGAALASATTKKDKPSKKSKSSSTKNGTTAAAKRPSRAKTSTPVKETVMSKKTASTATTKKAPATSKPGKSKKAASAAKAKPNGNAATDRGRPSTFDVSKTIKVVAEENPRREGSKGYENWAIIKRYDGKTVEGYLKAGGGTDHLRWDINHKNVKLV